MKYDEFLESKRLRTENHGFDIELSTINKLLFDFQKDIVKWAIKKGRSAVFADCGLGKSFIQLEWARILSDKGLNIIILAPLGVTLQTKNEGIKLGIDINIVKESEDVMPGINIINYERIDKIDINYFQAVVLDESSILKNFTGKTKNALINKFRNYNYKLCCTATPSPNDIMELLNHADFLGIMESNKALAIWFINDTTNLGKYRLKGHAEDEFWKWVSSWAVSLENPSDLGYCDSGYDLPKLIEITETAEKRNKEFSGKLFYEPEKISATNLHKEKRETITEKIEKINEIILENENKSILVWCYSNAESEALKKAIPQAVEIKGSDKNSKKEKAAADFQSGDIKILISKPSIFGLGLNFQICHTVIFMGLDFSFEMYYQALRRTWRFGQQHDVTVYVVIADTEKEIIDVIKRKASSQEVLRKEMYKKAKEYNDLGNSMTYRMDYKSNIYKTDNITFINGDSVIEIKKIPDETMDMMIFSPPFSNLYIYSDSYRDMGNNINDDEFYKNFNYLIPELKRILKEGRICAVHVKNLAMYKTSDGVSGIKDFRGNIINMFVKSGFVYHSESCIWTDPVFEMCRTKTQRLLYKQLRKDASKSGIGLAEYVLYFRKWDKDGVSEIPVEHFSSEIEVIERKKDKYPEIYNEYKSITGKLNKLIFLKKQNISEYLNIFELNKWQKYASPVWFDILRTDVLNSSIARDNADEKHICPLQLETIKRPVELFTNPGEVVFTPFAGIASEIYQSVKLGRKGFGIELKEGYFKQGIKNLKTLDIEKMQLKLF